MAVGGELRANVFGESGDNEAIFSKFGINTGNIVSAVREIVRRSKKQHVF